MSPGRVRYGRKHSGQQASHSVWGAGTARPIRPHWALAEPAHYYESAAIATYLADMYASEATALIPRGSPPASTQHATKALI